MHVYQALSAALVGICLAQVHVHTYYMYVHVYTCTCTCMSMCVVPPDTEELVSFASNLLCLGIGEGLLSLVNDAETRARETVHQAEEELEG